MAAGERDQNAPLTTVIAACGMIPNGQFGIIPHAGYPVFPGNFPAVWACIAPFLHEKPGH